MISDSFVGQVMGWNSRSQWKWNWKIQFWQHAIQSYMLKKKTM